MMKKTTMLQEHLKGMLGALERGVGVSLHST
jgi:hypothetical protein